MLRLRHLLWPVGLALLPGCGVLSGGRIDAEIRERTAQIEAAGTRLPRDQPPPSAQASPIARPADPPSTPPAAAPALEALATPAEAGEVRQAAWQKDDKDRPPPRRLLVPPDLPGADAPPITLPDRDKPEEVKRYLRELYPPSQPLPPFTPPAPGPEGRPMSLSDLQRLAELYSPAVKNAAAAVEAAKGAVQQAGAYPNPTFAFEHDTAETGPAGYPGFFLDQVIKTGNKLKLQQAAAMMDLLNARVALRRARSDLAYAVRGAYFGVLVARESMRVNEALFRFTDELYKVQIELARDTAAPYEPMLLRPLVDQARLNVLTARNQYLASWRQLAAALGLPEMPPSELAGRVDMAVPAFDYDVVRERVLRQHTDVLTAFNAIYKARYNLELARTVPLPDVDLRLLVQKDYTTPPNQIVHSFQASIPVPLWDQNKGAIRQAEGLLAQAAVGPEQARNTLTGSLADAFNRYRTAREAVEIAQRQVRDQIRGYRAAWTRRETLPNQVAFGDLLTAEQTLVGYLGAYLTALGAQWQAVVDVANLLQTDDLYQAGPCREMEPIPDLEHLLPVKDGPHGLKKHGKDGEVPAPPLPPPFPPPELTPHAACPAAATAASAAPPAAPLEQTGAKAPPAQQGDGWTPAAPRPPASPGVPPADATAGAGRPGPTGPPAAPSLRSLLGSY
jgi:cobalt-zinc-cadmium efflux system outer membrane protein